MCIDDQIPFDIPDSWEWARIKSFAVDVFSGKSPVYSKVPTEYKVIGQAVNQPEGLDLRLVKYTTQEFWNRMEEKYFLRKHDVILNTLGNGTLGRSGIVDSSCESLLTDGHLFVFRTKNEILSFFLYIYLQHQKESIEKSANGSTNQTFLNLTRTLEWLIPVPPLEEQARIARKIKEIRPCVDSYSNLYERNRKLDSIFPEFLKKSILQEAVQGKLVPQDPNDEPASVLLEQIRAEKERLIAEGKIKRDKHESRIFKRDNSHYELRDGVEVCIDDEIPFEIPDSWEWVRIGSICEVARGGSPRPIKNYLTESSDGINWIKIGDTDKGGKYINRTKEKIKPAGVKKSRLIHAGDFLLTNSMSFGRPYISNIEGCIHDGWLVLSGYDNAYNQDFLYYMLSSAYAYYQFCEVVSGAVVKNLNSDKVATSIFPLPPLEEQKRIVKKINSLKAITDLL